MTLATAKATDELGDKKERATARNAAKNAAIAGARVAWIVHTLPLLPVASVVLAMHPRTKHWLEE